MKYLKAILTIIGLLALTACGGGSGTASTTGSTVTGVATATQISVVTAK